MKFDVGTMYLLVAGSGLVVSAFGDRAKTVDALFVAAKIALLILPVLFLIFVLMGIVQAFVPQETIASTLGNKIRSIVNCCRGDPREYRAYTAGRSVPVCGIPA